ncbi:hypothetical protein Krad_4568 (plasmid) [Kineococcus radiotolerans SRS30216 = ATCC BAA-149]|uniref:Uncharacterized protein n=1 Tax=Kineococcus radiotolerans (strain ATCC BAA-149 / DSM 14245 / SRS30216) TaxID=266940 RepID=A6WGT8_KINRD|nr:hypothetical protein Krad_4568 [Kineococcus radiotolerans SRS30216 = ATCC BAA-149]
MDADLVTPGLWGFLTLFLSAVAVYFLGRSMARRVQRVNHRARLQAEAEAQDRAEARGRAEVEGEDRAEADGEAARVGETPAATVGEAEGGAHPEAATELAAEGDHPGVPTGTTSLDEDDAAPPRHGPEDDHHKPFPERDRTVETAEPWQRP